MLNKIGSPESVDLRSDVLITVEAIQTAWAPDHVGTDVAS